MATLEEQMKKVQDDIEVVKEEIKAVKLLPEGHSERGRLIELDKQLTLLQEEKNLLLKERAAAQQPVAVAAAQAAPAGPTDAQILEEIRQEFDGYKRFLKPVKVYALWLERLLHAYLFSSRVRVVVALYSFILGLVVFCVLQAWVPATAWVLSFCVMLASMHRDHQNNDMKTLKEHLDKLKKVQSKFQQMRHVHPHAQTLKAEVGVVVSELESWYQAAEQWFRIH